MLVLFLSFSLMIAVLNYIHYSRMCVSLLFWLESLVVLCIYLSDSVILLCQLLYYTVNWFYYSFYASVCIILHLHLHVCFAFNSVNHHEGKIYILSTFVTLLHNYTVQTYTRKLASHTDYTQTVWIIIRAWL